MQLGTGGYASCTETGQQQCLRALQAGIPLGTAAVAASAPHTVLTMTSKANCIARLLAIRPAPWLTARPPLQPSSIHRARHVQATAQRHCCRGSPIVRLLPHTHSCQSPYQPCSTTHIPVNPLASRAVPKCRVSAVTHTFLYFAVPVWPLVVGSYQSTHQPCCVEKPRVRCSTHPCPISALAHLHGHAPDFGQHFSYTPMIESHVPAAQHG